MFPPRSPSYRPNEWELTEAAHRGISVRGLWAMLYAEAALVDLPDEDESEGAE